MIRIVTPDERQKKLYEKIHPFFINSVELENTAGVADFALYEYKKPTMEFLNNLDPQLGLGLFKTTYAVYAIRDFCITPPYDKYKFFFATGSEYVDARAYCEKTGAKMVFSEEEVYFIQERHKGFPLRGMMFITTDRNLLSFTTTHEAGAIKISENLYLKSKIPYATIFNHAVPYKNITVHSASLNDTGGVVFGEQIIAEASEVSISQDFALSNTGIVIYNINNEAYHSIIPIDYYSFNKSRGIIDIEKLKTRLSKGRPDANIEVVALYVFINDLRDNDPCCKLKASEIFPEYVEYISTPKFGLTNLVQDKNASLVPVRSTDPRLTIDYGNDDEYFSSIKSLSRRIARDLLNAEYSQIRNDIPLSSITDEGLAVHVNNRYSQVISVYINGKFHHKPFTRTDVLGSSKIVIPKADLAQYGEIKTIEVNVEPLYTGRYDLVIDGIMQYADRTGRELKTQAYLVPTYNKFNSDLEKEVYVNGFLLDSAFYTYENYNGRGFIFIKKSFNEPIMNVTVIANATDMYDRKIVNYNDLMEYSVLDEHCKVFYGGILVPYNHIENLYAGKVINVNFHEDKLTGENANIILLQIKNNPHWNMYLKDANVNPLINGYINVQDSKVALVTTEMIFNFVKKFKSENTVIDIKYPLANHNDSLIQRTKFLYEYMLIGKLLEWNCNEAVTNASVSDIEVKYPAVVQGDGFIIDCNSEVLEMTTMNETYGDYARK